MKNSGFDLSTTTHFKSLHKIEKLSIKTQTHLINSPIYSKTMKKIKNFRQPYLQKKRKNILKNTKRGKKVGGESPKLKMIKFDPNCLSAETENEQAEHEQRKNNGEI